MPEVDFYDLTLDEARRRSAVVTALGDNWDPARALAEEQMAYDLLYSGLDERQQALFDDLVSAGVLPGRVVTDVAD